MKKLIFILLLLIPSTSFAQWNFFPDNFILKDSGTTIEGAGKIIDFGDNIDVTYDSLNTIYHVTADSSTVGTLNDLTDVNSSTQTAGNFLVSNAVSFNSVAITGDCTIAGDGTLTCSNISNDPYDEAGWNAVLDAASKDAIRDKFETVGGSSKWTDGGAVTYLTAQGDHLAVGGITSDSAAFYLDTSQKTLLSREGFKVGDGTTKDSVMLSVDLFGSDTAAFTYDSDNDEIDVNKPLNIAGNVKSKTTLGLTINEDQDASSDGDFTYKGGIEDKLIKCSAADDLCRIGDYDTNYMEITSEGVARFIGLGSVSMDSLTEVNSSTVTSGNLLVANGLAFNSVALSGDCTLDGEGTATCSASSTSNKLYSWYATDTAPEKPATYDSIAPTGLDTGTNMNMFTASYDQTADECRQVQFKIPNEVNTSGTARFQVSWYSKTATVNSVDWLFAWHPINEGESWDSTTSYKIAGSDVVQGSVDQITETIWTESMSTLGWTADETITGYFCRDGDSGGDTLVGDAEAIQFSVEVPRS